MSLELSNIMKDLHLLVKELDDGTRRKSKEGHEFENDVAKIISIYKNELDLEVYNPRTTLPFMTYSSISHQLDGVFKFGSTYYLIECKHRKTVSLEQIGYFNSKLLEYSLGAWKSGLSQCFKGLFLASSPIGDNPLKYAISYGITVVDPETPALCHMISTTTDNDLKQAFFRLYNTIAVNFDYLHPSLTDSEKCLKDYRYLIRQWLKEPERI